MKKYDYNLPDAEEIFFDTKSHEIINDELVTSAYKTPEEPTKVLDPPFVRIQKAADKFGLIIQDPKKNCRKCNGRGFLGIAVDPVTHLTTEKPIPCPCIYPKAKDEFEKVQRETAQQMMEIKNMNRSQRRQQEKLLRKKR